jgi:hypothetical protein
LGSFLVDFAGHNWPVMAGAAAIALVGPFAARRGGFRMLLGVGVVTWAALTITNHIMLAYFARKNPTWSMPSSEAWLDSAWGGLMLALVLGAVALIARRRWPLAFQVPAALALAVLIPPFGAAGLLVVGCYVFGSCL